MASCCVPVRDVSLEVGFEALEGLPVLAAKELVLEVPENLGLKDKKSWSEPDLSALRCEKVWFKVVGGQL